MVLKAKHVVMSAVMAGGLAISLSALGQYTGPSNDAAVKVASILENPRDDQDVLVRGRLLRQLGDEKYVFSDGTGEIVVEIDDDDFPRQPIDDKMTVELRGEVDTSRRRPPEIEVDSVRIVK